MNISDIIDNITNTLDSAKMPANVLPPFLLKCTALNRPGLSAYKIASRIIENNKALGIPELVSGERVQNAPAFNWSTRSIEGSGRASTRTTVDKFKIYQRII